MLSNLIGQICHVYLDDIIIWSLSLAEHKANIALVLEALRAAQLYCLTKKSSLFATEVHFLGHDISVEGIATDGSKVERVLHWQVLTSVKQVQQFLGLVRYISMFLPMLVEHTAILMPLMKKECNKSFPAWTSEHQSAFEAIKGLVLGRNCLTTIDHHNPGDNQIYVTCDASKRHMGAMLSFGKSWESARLVAFKSRQLKAAELHYPVHEQEMLSIMRALMKWRMDLLGTHIHIYTDHKTIQNFDGQWDLSLQQVRWMEYLSQYEYTITYIKGEDNTIADALSRLTETEVTTTQVGAVFEIESNPQLYAQIRRGYANDKWCKGIVDDLK